MDNNTRGQLSLKIDYRIITLLLLAVIAAMLFMWKPWQDTISAASRTIRVTGEAELTAEPDEYVFYPSYDFKNASKQAALDELSKKSDAVIAKLKELGVADSKIKTDSSGYDFPVYGEETSTPTYTLRLTVTVANRDLAQKVQDYLITTEPTGSVSPQATFSDKKRKELENRARDDATKEARAKAEQSAENLGFSLGKVKAVEDGAGFDGIIRPFAAQDMATSGQEKTTQLTVQPGENELTYSVTVTYFVK
jgi:uncharacterized protein YggE